MEATPGTFIVPEDEALSIVGPFPGQEEAIAFYHRHMDGFGAQIRDGASPDDWMAVVAATEEDGEG